MNNINQKLVINGSLNHNIPVITTTGKEGLSAYEVAVNNGFIGTLDEWLLSLKGEKGDKGDPGSGSGSGSGIDISLVAEEISKHNTDLNAHNLNNLLSSKASKTELNTAIQTAILDSWGGVY